MNIKNDIDKICYIFEKFKNKEARIWNLDTDVYNTWKRFVENINKEFSFSEFNFNQLEIAPIAHPKKEGQKYFYIKINNVNVTPSKRNKVQGWSKSAVRQFLQEGSFFGIIIFSPKQDFTDGIKLKISPKIAAMLWEDFEWGNLILSSIKNSLFSYASHINNFGLSCFFAYIVKYNFELLKQMPKVIHFRWVKIKKENNPFHSLDDSCEDVGLKIYKETYKNLVNILNFNYSLNEIVEFLFSILENKEDKEIAKEGNIEILRHENFIKKSAESSIKLKSERCKLRANIIKNRVYNKTKYSDIQLSDEPYIDQTEAAHIYNISSIKKECDQCLKNNIDVTWDHLIKLIMNQASNHNNGLLIPINIHKEYDRDIFQFDIKGNIIFQEENLDRIKSLNLGLENSKIKESVLNNEMVSFLKKRIA